MKTVSAPDDRQDRADTTACRSPVEDNRLGIGADEHMQALPRLDEIYRGGVEQISFDELFRKVRQRLTK